MIRVQQGKEVTDIRIRKDGEMRQVVAIRKRVGSTLRTLWELIRGYLISSDSQVLVSSDGKLLRAKDQI